MKQRNMGWQLHLKLKSFLTGSLIQNRTLLTYSLHTEMILQNYSTDFQDHNLDKLCLLSIKVYLYMCKTI